MTRSTETLISSHRPLLDLATKVMVATFVLSTCSACATRKAPEPLIITKEVPVPVATSCVPKSLASAPSYPDTDEALRHADDEGFLKLLLAGRDLRTARLAQVEPVIKGCR